MSSWFRVSALLFLGSTVTGCGSADSEQGEDLPSDAPSRVDEAIVDATNARFITYNASTKEITILKSHGWSADWNHVVPMTDSSHIAFYRKHDGFARIFSYDTSGNITLKKEYTGWSAWTHVAPSPGGLTYGLANALFYDRMTGALSAKLVDGAGAAEKFSQTIVHPKIDTDSSVGWDIVAPVVRSGAAKVLFYKRVTGQYKLMTYDSVTQKLIDDGSGVIEPVWDEIKCGNLTGPATDHECALFNQDTGRLNVWNLGSSTPFTGAYGIPHTGKLAVRDFGGSSAQIDDILLYQSVVKDPAGGESSWFTTGARGSFFLDTTSFARSLHAHLDGWGTTWTHVEPTRIGNGFLLYRNAKQVKVKFVFAGMTNAEAQASYTSTRLADQLQALDRTFAVAGIDFELSSAYYRAAHATDDVVLKDFECGDDRGGVNERLNALVTAGSLPDDALFVLVNKTNNSTSCSSSGANFVALVRPDVGGTVGDREWYADGTKLQYAGPQRWVLAHEVGHYFGLIHNFYDGVNDTAAIEAFLAGTSTNHGTVYNLDTDWLAMSEASRKVYDTMPGLDTTWWKNVAEPAGLWRCDDSDVLTFTARHGTGAGDTTQVTMRATPHDVMSYVNCDRVSVLSHDQVRVVRQQLYRTGAYDSGSKDWVGGRLALIQ